LEVFAATNIATYADHLVVGVMKDVQLKRTSPIKVPHLIRTNPMKRREVTGLEKIQDPCADASGATEPLSKGASRNGI
jgi:hypothetical protein